MAFIKKEKGIERLQTKKQTEGGGEREVFSILSPTGMKQRKAG